MTTGILNATILAITVGGTKITHQLQADLSVTMEPRESLTKDNAGWKDRFSGVKDWELSGEAELAMDATYGLSALLTAFLAGNTVAVEFTTAETGDTKLSGNAMITALNTTAGVEENAKLSYTFLGSGAITKGTVG